MVEVKSKILPDNMELKFFLRLGYLFSISDIDEYVEVNGTKDIGRDETIDSKSMFIQPGLKYLYKFNNFDVGFSFSWFADFDKLYVDHYSYSTQWDGVRLTLLFETSLGQFD